MHYWIFLPIDRVQINADNVEATRERLPVIKVSEEIFFEKLLDRVERTAL